MNYGMFWVGILVLVMGASGLIITIRDFLTQPPIKPKQRPNLDTNQTQPFPRRKNGKLKATLIVQNQGQVPSLPARFNIYDRISKIGRVQKFADLVIDHLTVSRLHCTIKEDTHGNFYLYNEGASNGTFLNEKELIQAGDRILLKSGDLIRLGKIVLRFEYKSQDDDRGNLPPKDDEDDTKPYRPHKSDN